MCVCLLLSLFVCVCLFVPLSVFGDTCIVSRLEMPVVFRLQTNDCVHQKMCYPVNYSLVEDFLGFSKGFVGIRFIDFG